MTLMTADLLYTADLVAGLWIVLIISLTSMVLCPLFWWTLLGHREKA